MTILTRTRAKKPAEPPQPPQQRIMKTRSMTSIHPPQHKPQSSITTKLTRTSSHSNPPPPQPPPPQPPPPQPPTGTRKKKITPKNNLTNPKVVVPLHPTLGTTTQEPASNPPETHSQNPSSSQSNLPSAGPSSQLTRLITSPPKPRRKRLFEDVDTSSQDLFSFLDQKPHTNKLLKPTRRPVFKSSQTSFLKPNNRLASAEPEAGKNKTRILASNKLLAGSQPQLKKLKTTEPRSMHQGKPIQSQSNQPPLSPPQLELQSTCNPILPNVQDDISPQVIDTPIPSTSNQPTSTKLTNEQLPITQDSCSLSSPNPTPVTLLSSNPAPTDPPKSVNIEPISTHPLLLTLDPSIDPALLQNQPTPQDQSTDQTDEVSMDAIDFLSPKKKVKQTIDGASGALNQLETKNQSSDQVNSSESCLVSPPLNMNPLLTATLTSNETSDEKNQHIDPAFQPDPHVQQPPIIPEATLTTVTSPKSQLTSDHPPSPPSNPALDIQDAPSTLVTLPSLSGELPLAPAIEDSVATNQPALPDSSSIPIENITRPDETSLGQDGPMSPMRAETPDHQVEGSSTPPKPSSKLILKRTSPIKHLTMPTSIPIMKLIPTSAPQGLPPPHETDQASRIGSSAELVSSRPSMLPRRALKPTMGTMQPLTYNTVPSLDAIIETSPEKRPVRDALSAASLNRSRGLGAPPRMIFTGGIKSKAEAIFSRPIAGTSNPPFTRRPIGAAINAYRPPFKPHQQTLPPGNPALKDQPNQPKVDAHTEEQTDEEDRSVDTSATSIATQDSSSSSMRAHHQQFSGNISIDTQDRLTKLQIMLTKMGRSESGESSTLHNPYPRRQYQEYEVDVKTGDDDDQQQEQIVEASHGTRSSRRRSSSVPLNYSETNMHSRSGSSRSQYVSTNANGTGKNPAKGVPVGRRRVSNILPSALVDTVFGGATDQDDGGSSSASSADNPASIASAASADALNPHAPNARPADRTRRRSVHQPPAAALAAPTPLRNVVAFVDVRTAEGDDAGKVFVEMLKALGAKVVGRPVVPLTHIIFKAGRPTTIERYMQHPRPKPHMVGIGWLVRCREMVSKADEGPYKIDVHSAQVTQDPARAPHLDLHPAAPAAPNPSAAHSRRKSMEPKALSLLNSAVRLFIPTPTPADLPSDAHPSSAHLPDRRHPLSRSCISQPVTAAVAASSSQMGANGGDRKDLAEEDRNMAESIDKARRKSLQFLPKVGSPLACKVLTIS